MTALHEALPALLDGLFDEEGFILGYRFGLIDFGLIDGRPRNLGEIAAILAACGTPMAHQHVYAVQQQALAKLRRPELEAAIAALLPEGDAA